MTQHRRVLTASDLPSRRTATAPQPASGCSPSAASASSTATSAPARSTRCARRSSPRSAPAARRRATAVLGVLSLILWALIVVVTLKYVVILLRADNKGEGGTLALMALAQRAIGKSARLAGAARHHQRRAVLRRRGDHAGAVGAVGGRRPEDRDAGLRSLCRAADGGDPDRAVRRAVARHRAGSRPSSVRSRWSGSSPSRSPASGTSPPIRACSPPSIRSTASAFSPATA